MKLNTQITLLIFSFIYGILFSILLSINYKIIYKSKKSFQIILTLLVIGISLFIYFIGLKKTNNLIVHPYAIIMVILGFIFECFIASKIKK